MKSGLVVSLLCLLLLPVAATGAHKHPAPAPAPTDSSYAFALAAANRFLHAWQTGDLETGMVLLSDGLRRAHDPETFEQFFFGGPDRGFEIMAGTGNRGRYRFPVVLVTPRGSRVQRRVSELTVVNTGKNDWVVDKLP